MFLLNSNWQPKYADIIITSICALAATQAYQNTQKPTHSLKIVKKPHKGFKNKHIHFPLLVPLSPSFPLNKGQERCFPQESGISV